MSSETGWCTIESDPAVFSELIEKLGVSGLDVEEVYDLEPAGLHALGKVYGLIFLFKWTAAGSSASATSTFIDPTEGIFFARQIVQNACATQAILSILLNLPSGDPAVELGAELTQFAQFVSDFDPELKGMALGEHEAIRQIHNLFSRPEALYMDDDAKDASKEGTEDPFHFVSIMPVGGQLLEFDGLQQAPILLGRYDDETEWIRSALLSIQQRIGTMQSDSGGSEIRFNLMAVIQDRALAINTRLGALSADEEWQRPELEAMLAADQTRKAERHGENQLRRHNFIPLIMGILECMAKRRPDIIESV